FELPVSRVVRPRFGRQTGCRTVPLGRYLEGGAHARSQGRLGRLAASLQRLKLGRHGGLAAAEDLDLLSIEGNLLLEAVDRHFALVRRFARPRRSRLALDELNANAPEIRLRLRDTGRRHGFT